MTRFMTDEAGATAIEYALIASFVCLAILGGAFSVGQAVNQMFVTSGTHLAN